MVDNSNAQRPLLIVQTGFDGTAEELYFTWVQGAIKRGYNCLIFEGPGQGGVIREQGIPFRPNWESVITPITDYACKLPQVDKNKLALMGISLGGYFVPRALAYEKRIKVGIANGGVYDMHAMVMKQGSPEMEAQLDDPEAAKEIDKATFPLMENRPDLRWGISHGMYVFGAKTPSEWMKMTRDYHLRDTAPKITCKMLVVDSENDFQMKNQSKMLFDALKSPKEFMLFKAFEGAGEHCQVGATMLSNERIYNWLDANL